MYRYIIMIFFGTTIFLPLCSKFCVLGGKPCDLYDNNATVEKLQDECVTLGVCQCRLHSHVTWKFNNTPIFVGSISLTNGTWTFSTNNSLIILSVKQSDVGTYTCLCSGAVQTQYILMLKDEVELHSYVTTDDILYTSNRVVDDRFLEAKTSSIPMPHTPTDMNFAYDSRLWLIFVLATVTLLIGSMASVLAVWKFTKRRSKQKTNQQVEDYEECRAAGSKRTDVFPHSNDRQGNAAVAGQNEVFLKRDCVTLLSRLPGGGKMKYWTAVFSSDVSNKSIFIAKTLSDSAQLKDLYNFQKIANQLKALTSHKNIVDILGTDDTEVPCFVYQHYEEGGTLRDFMLRNCARRRESQSNSNVTERIVLPFEDWKLQPTKFALDVAEGMTFLRRNNICHPGICSRKVLLSRYGTCKLYDFVPEEIARNRLIDVLEKKCPVLAWLPPEAIFLRRYSWQADIWSFAVVLWEIFSFGQTPYEGLATEEIETEIRCNRCLSQPLCCPGGVYSIMLSSWNVSYEERPTFSVITQNLKTAMNSFKQESISENDVTEDPNYFVLEERVLENDYESEMDNVRRDAQ